MLIRFLKDFRSAATGENFYEAGQEVDLPRGAEVVAEGAAEIVTIDSRRGQVQPKDEPLPFDDTPRVSSAKADEETRATKRGKQAH